MPVFKKKKPSARRNQVRKTIAAERLSQIGRLVDPDSTISILLVLTFVVFCVPVVSFELVHRSDYLHTISILVIVLLISVAAAFYIHHYQGRIIKNHARAVALVGLFILLLLITKLGVMLFEHSSWATGTAVTGYHFDHRL